MEQQVAIVKVQSLGRDDPWSSYVEVNATRLSNMFGSTIDITWHVTAIQTKEMFIGQEFEVTIKPYIREEPPSIVLDPGYMETPKHNKDE